MVNADFEVRHYLSWIEELTTNQTAGGSNPSWRTISANAVSWWNLRNGYIA